MSQSTLNLDDEGLLSLKNITRLNGNVFYGEQEIFIEPNVNSVFDYLMLDENLKDISKIKCSMNHIGMKRAPIFGVPFFEAFNKIRSLDIINIKSSYQRTDWAEIKKNGVVGTLVAHIEKTKRCIKFECWELFNVETDIFYIHGEFDLKNDVFTHLDGSTISYTKNEIEELMYNHIISRGVKKDKLFRLDGRVTLSEGREILNRFLPLEDLSCEYFELPIGHAR